jgi:chromosome segregation ATPase
MDAEKVLLAIEEKRKWEHRAAETEKRLEELRTSKAILLSELKSIEEKLRYYTALADSQRQYNVAVASGRLFDVGGSRSNMR